MNKQNSSLKAYAYEYLKKKILDCEIKPGEYINEKDILDETEIGRTPFREAILILQSEHLVEARPRHGIFATKLTKEDVVEVFSMRKMLEPVAVVTYLDRIDLSALLESDEKMERLSRTSQEKDTTELCRLDMDFHSFFINNSGNSRLIRLFTPIFQDAYRISMFNALTSKSYNLAWKETYVQHHQILQAIFKENKQEIIEAYTMHLNYYLVSVLENVARFNDEGA